MSTTDKHGANRPRKNDEHNQVCTKTAGHSRNDACQSGHSRRQDAINE